MITAIDTWLMTDLLSNIYMPISSKMRKISCVRFNSSEHKVLRKRGKEPYGALQLVTISPDFSRSARTCKITKYTDSTLKRVKKDKYPSPISMNYQIAIYTENERELIYARMALLRALPETLSQRLSVDVYGDGELEEHIVHFVRGIEIAGEIFDQPRQFQVIVPYSAEATVFFHSAYELSTFWNEGTIEATVLDRQAAFAEDAVGPTDTIIDTVT